MYVNTNDSFEHTICNINKATELYIQIFIIHFFNGLRKEECNEICQYMIN